MQDDEAGEAWSDAPDAACVDGFPEPTPTGCPSSDCADACRPLDINRALSFLGGGTCLALELFDGGFAAISTVSDSGWSQSDFSYFMSKSFDQELPVRIELSDAKATAAVWTGSEFGVFLSDDGGRSLEGRFMRVDASGRILHDSHVSRAYDSVVWAGHAFAALWQDANDTWHLARIDLEGTETDRFSHDIKPMLMMGFAWSGSHFVMAMADKDSAEDGRYRYTAAATGWELIMPEAPVVIDENGLVRSGRLFEATPGAAALWIESRSDADLIRIYARFLDDGGYPCGPAVLIDEVKGIPPPDHLYGWPPMMAYEGSWDQGRSLVAYTRMEGEDQQLVIRSLLSGGEVGEAWTDRHWTDLWLLAFPGNFVFSAERDRLAFAYSYACAADAPACINVHAGSCL